MAKVGNTARAKVRRDLARARRDLAALRVKKTRNKRNMKPSVRGVTQGTMSSVPKPFGSAASDYLVFDATHPSHLALPRATGPYTVLRTTSRHTLTNKFNVFCPELHHEAAAAGTRDTTYWTGVIGRAGITLTSPINGANNCQVMVDNEFARLGPAASVVPAAFTVQLMNADALQTTTGVVYVGRSTAQYKLGMDGRTWEVIGDGFVSFMSPRICTAGKLALNGVKINAFPLNMSEMSNFYPPDTSAVNTPATTWNGSGNTAITAGLPAALTPIVIWSASDNPTTLLEVLVTVEWRVRFDPASVAAGTHVQHPTTPDHKWDKAVNAAQKLGSGAVDIMANVASGLEIAGRIAPMIGV